MEVTIQLDHNPLESIFKKPLNTAPMHLQCMLLRLQRYNLRVVYKKLTEMFHVDTLSRAYQTENLVNFVHSLEAIDATLGLPVSANCLQQIQHATAEDPGVSLLSDVIKGDWPEEKHSAWPALRAY